MKSAMSSIPVPVRRALRPAVAPLVRHAPGRTVRWGSLRRVRPFSRHYGWDRGDPVDRWYIDSFLSGHGDAIRGDVLEVRQPHYARRFGERASRVHVVDIDPSNRQATLIADLTEPESLPAARYDCAIITQTLQFLSDVPAALANVRRSLRPGGTLLVTVPCLGKVDHEAPSSDRWRWMPSGLELVLRESFPHERVHVEGRGNVLAGVAFLMGLAQQELRTSELACEDRSFPIVACARVDVEPASA